MTGIGEKDKIMHELGIIVHVIKTVEEVGQENNLTAVKAVTCQIGEVSGVVPEYLLDCWSYACRKSELLKDSELKIEIQKGVTFCEDCEKTYSTVEYGKKCPYCESEATYLVEGNGFSIKEIEGE